jgi:hypothetical protein
MRQFTAILERFLPFAFINEQMLLGRFAEENFSAAGNFDALLGPAV